MAARQVVGAAPRVCRRPGSGARFGVHLAQRGHCSLVRSRAPLTFWTWKHFVKIYSVQLEKRKINCSYPAIAW